jgi:hypothetical protein
VRHYLGKGGVLVSLTVKGVSGAMVARSTAISVILQRPATDKRHGAKRGRCCASVGKGKGVRGKFSPGGYRCVLRPLR